MNVLLGHEDFSLAIRHGSIDGTRSTDDHIDGVSPMSHHQLFAIYSI